MGLSKEQAAEKQLEAALYLQLNNFSDEAVHTLVAAARGILYGLARHKPNEVLDKWDRNVLAKVVGNDTAAIRKYQNRVANFLKHADRDPDESLSGVNLKVLNEYEMQLCILALSICVGQISKRLNWALWYLGLSRHAIIPFDSLAKEYTGSVGTAEVSMMRDRGEFRRALIHLFNSNDT